MKVVLGIGALVLLAACATKIKGDGEGQVIKSKKPEALSKAVIGYKFIPKDSTLSTVIDSAYIVGNTMMIKVHYGGGCSDHFFSLHGNQAISKSLPPIRTITLSHSGKQDVCKAIIYKTLRFDISDFAYKQENGSEIFLNLEGYDEQLKYTYITK